MTFWPTTVPVLPKPDGLSIWNIWFGMLAVEACVICTLWPAAVTPPQVGGSVGSTEPSKSFCATAVPVEVGFTPGMPLAPGNRPYRLSKPRFSA